MACNDFFGRPPLSDLAAQVLPVRFLLQTRRRKTMILVLNKDISPQQDARLTAYLEGLGLTVTRQL